MGEVPGLIVRTRDGFQRTAELPERPGLDDVPLPARELADPFRHRYRCLFFRPVWLVETARGCPFRCSFCSVWSLSNRTFRERSIGAVVEDFVRCGDSIFVIDDLFWNHPERSLELARALVRRGVKKRWVLVQSRADVACKHPELLEAWRPIAHDFDIFYGFEAATDTGLAGVTKDATVGSTVAAVELSRSLRFGVTGNFLIDPDWDEHDFHALWDFVARHGIRRGGFTIMTPLPGTEYFDRVAHRLAGEPWFKFDMHHLLWEPKLGERRFFELYAETWRRSVLNLSGEKKIWSWLGRVRPLEIPDMTRMLLRTQRMMRAEAYLAEHAAEERERSAFATRCPVHAPPDPRVSLPVAPRTAAE